MKNMINCGGILAHGIPEFRLEQDVLEKNLKQILDLGIKTQLNKELGKNLTIDELEQKYDAIFISIGANIPSKMNIEGENLEGVYGGNKLLENKNHPNYKNKKVAVIGGGNVAMDCARTINKMGAEKVYIIYRRAEEQMPAEKKEIEDAKMEGIQFLFQNNIVKILPKQNTSQVEKIECIKTELIETENGKRPTPVEIKNSNYIMNIDYVIMAIGSNPEKEIIRKLKLDMTEKGYIKVNDNYQTSNKKIFAGGDIVGTKQTVAWAAKTGRDAATSIEKFLLE